MSELVAGTMKTTVPNVSKCYRPVIFVAAILAVVVLVIAGTAYRLTSKMLRRIIGAPVQLASPLSSFPLHVMGWEGEDIPIPVNIQKVAATDDFCSRRYVNRVDQTWVNLYVAYTARPRTMLGHRPQVCYPAIGWVHDSTERSVVVSRQGRKIPCFLHRFHRPQPEDDQVIVLNFYCVNGSLTDDENVFTGLNWRTPNLEGNPARYVVQVQVSSVAESAIRRAVEDMADVVFGFFPGFADERAQADANNLQGWTK